MKKLISNLNIQKLISLKQQDYINLKAKLDTKLQNEGGQIFIVDKVVVNRLTDIQNRGYNGKVESGRDWGNYGCRIYICESGAQAAAREVI